MSDRGPTLHVFPDAGRVEEALLDEAARRGGFADASGFLTFAQLIERLEGARFLGRRPASPLASRAALWACAQELGSGPFGAFVHEPAFARAALELVFELKAGDVPPATFAEAVEHLPPQRLPRARYLARLYAAYEEKLLGLKLADREDATRGARDRLDAKGLPAFLRAARAVEVRHLYDFSPLRLDLLRALAARCEEAEVGFLLEAPAAGAPGVDLAVDPALAAFERRWQEAVHLSAQKADFTGPEYPLGALGRFLFSADSRKGCAADFAPALELCSAASSLEECRLLARRAAACVAAGTPPEQVVIAFRDLGEEAEGVVEALEELGIPARLRRGAPLASTAAGRVALELPLAMDEGFPAARVAWLLGSRYVPAVSEGAPGAPGALLAQASIRDDVVGAQGERGAYEVRLGGLAARLEQRKREREAREVRALLERCQRLFAACRKLPVEGSASEMLARWWGCVEALGLLDAVNQPESRAEEGSFLGRAVLRSLARDQAAAEALKQLALDLAEALKLTGAGKQRMGRRTFYRWLADAAADYNLVPRGPRGGAVRVLDLRELAGRSFAHVCVGGLAEGRLPGRAAPHLLFPDEDRRAVNIHLKRDAFRLAAGEYDGRLPWRLAEDRLLFYLALAATRGAATLCYARTAASGQEQVRSPFLDELERLTGARQQDVPARAVPLLDEALTLRHLQERVAIEALARPELRASEPDPDGPALRARFASERWFRFARELSAIEEERLRFFSDEKRPPGPYSGGAGNAELAAPLAELFKFGPARPLSSSAANKFGNCAFQGFLSYAIGLDEPEQPGEELDALGRGTFWHRVLEVLFPRLDAAGLLGRGADEVPAALIDEALDEAAREAEATLHVGHPALWRLAKERARMMARRLLSSDSHGLPFAGCKPACTELRFGDERSSPGWREVVVPGAPGQAPIHLEGKIDRLDAGPGALGVVDYKSGNLDSGSRLWEKLLVSEFQLPIYLYAARATGHQGSLDAALLGLKKGEERRLAEVLAKNEQTLDELLSVDPEVGDRLEEAGGKNLVRSLQSLVASLRAGSFPARPQDCGFCSFRAVCRISERSIQEVES